MTSPSVGLAKPASRNSGVYNLFFGCVTATIVRIVPRADVLGVVVIEPGIEKCIRLLVIQADAEILAVQHPRVGGLIAHGVHVTGPQYVGISIVGNVLNDL